MHKTITIRGNTSLDLQKKLVYVLKEYPRDKYDISYGEPYNNDEGIKCINVTIKDK